MDSAICPFCHLSVPSSELEWHANGHFEDQDDRRRQHQLDADFELAQQIALAPNSPFQSGSFQSEKAVSAMLCESTSDGQTSWFDGRTRENGEQNMAEKISYLIDLQTRSPFYKVEGDLMALLRNCLESEAENTKSILSSYVDHFQSIESEDVGWGCGWRNIQMLCSHLLVKRPEAREVLFGGSGFVPDIPSLQRWLEIAWERGFDAPGSDQFNHVVYGSKKWIGTTECAALLRSFGLRARIVDFGPKESESLYLSVPGSSPGEPLMGINNGRKRRTLNIYGPMDRYLPRDVPQASSSQEKKSNSSFVQLNDSANKASDNDSIQFGHQHAMFSEKTPLYFQHDGHSRTIVGIQVRHQKNGIRQYNLLVLDPAHKTAALERSLKEKVKWQRLIKRGVHTLKKPQYQLCYVDPGLASEDEMEKMKTIDSAFLEF
ncbi:hypothetical protein L6164_029853 [Bauhinia variegata]|uniref:Uncharacterized protein n=1 Tax=Bauhinia variegata TaxID=167791 RepID=A0ACB9LAV5_BAUVA|nr:hypothetical protein L6164_029853 [Bauhinia variegata]